MPTPLTPGRQELLAEIRKLAGFLAADLRRFQQTVEADAAEHDVPVTSLAFLLTELVMKREEMSELIDGVYDRYGEEIEEEDEES